MFELDAALGWKDNLTKIKAENKMVTIALKNGPTIKAKIKTMSEHSVVLHEIAQNEFFNMIIRMDDILSLSVRVSG